MSKEMSIIWLGALVAVLPYLGIPGAWRTVLFVLCGIAIVVIGFLLRGESILRGARRTEHNPFVESAGQQVSKPADESLKI